MVLRRCGTRDMSAVQKHLPFKSITDIRIAFEHYTKLANEREKKEKEEITKVTEDDSAINQWIKIVKRLQENETGVTDILSRVLKYIALFEKRPKDSDVNLRYFC